MGKIKKAKVNHSNAETFSKPHAMQMRVKT
jgi:hypothetical protein